MPGSAKVVELTPVQAAAADAELLIGRLRQQATLTDIGWRAIEMTDLDGLFDEAVQLCAHGVGADFCKLLEFAPETGRLLIRAGVGWRPGVVGNATLGIDLESPSGFAFRTGSPVISNHLEHEQRFRTPRLLVEHGVKRAINVPIALSQDRLWGVLAADSRNEGCFEPADMEFMQGMAHAIGAAIERDQARRQLEASADLLRHSDDPIIVWTVSDGVETWSEGAAELYGYTEEEALHRRPAELLSTSFPVPWREMLQMLRATGSWEGELRKRGKNGQEVVLWSRLRLVVDADGTERVLEVSRDVTSRKRMEDALRAAEARFRALYEAQQTAHLVLAPDFTIEAASAAYLQATKKRTEDLVGRNIFEAFPDNPGDSDSHGLRNLRASLRRVLDTRRLHRMPVQKYDIRGPDGKIQTRWWAPLNIPVFGPDGRVTNIIHQIEDVTPEMVERQKAAEAEAREARFRAVTEAIPALVFEADPQGRTTYVNAPFADFAGLPRSALLGDGWIEIVHPDDRAEVAAAWREAVQNIGFYEQAFRIQGAEDAWRWFMARANPIRDAEGSVEKWIGVCSDIDAAKKLEELQRLMMSEISHRVKNSLTLVSSLLGLQARTLEGEPRTALEDASSRVRAVAMVHDQLWRHADAREINLASFLSRLVAAVAATAPKHDTIVEVEPALVSAEVAVPIGLLVNELVTNAYKYAYPEGDGGEVRIVGAAGQGGSYRLEVSDRGRGLPEGFDPSRASSSLGMRVITSLAKQLGGQLRISSAEPGARFTLEFPPRAG